MEQILRTSIIPKRQQYVKLKDVHELNKEAICLFTATGFFMDDDTYWNDEKCLLPGHTHTLDAEGDLIKSVPWFDWHYTPRAISFEQALNEYVDLLTAIIKEQVGDKPVILPLSGGIDSRSQAMVLEDLGSTVHAYSYEFEGGYPETKIAQQIAKACGFRFEAFTIPKGYLWECIDALAQINGCYSEFTHPRQMAILPQLKQMEGIFSLGHWGDVLFDQGVPESTTKDTLVPSLLKKMVKPGGMELATALWDVWGIGGSFKDYLVSRIETALSRINIDDVSAKARAFKTMQWAHRWTTTNLSIFKEAHPITLPYYDDRMIDFICSIPEAYLADRRLQLAHLKQDKALSEITWHAQKPYHLNNYHYNKPPYNLPYRVIDKLKREFKNAVGNPYIQRNYELQFLGAENDMHLKTYLFDTSFIDFVSKDVVKDIYDKFKNINVVYYSHPTSMLLTLAVWHKHFNSTRL